VEGRIYYHPTFPDRGSRTRTEISHPVQAALPTQHPQQDTEPGTGERGFWRGCGGERRRETQLQRPEQLAEAAVQRPGQQPDAAFTASSTESSKQAQET